MWFIGATYLASHRILEFARPYLLAASRTRGVTVQLVERSDRQAVVLYSSHPDDQITKATYGYHFPLHAGSKGQVLLAFSDDAFIDAYLDGDLERLTPFTASAPAALRKRLRTIREQRYAITVGDVQPFTASMAAPILDRNDRVVACVCFVTKKSTMTNDARRDRLLEKLLETAQSVSLALGWRPGVRGCAGPDGQGKRCATARRTDRAGRVRRRRGNPGSGDEEDRSRPCLARRRGTSGAHRTGRDPGLPHRLDAGGQRGAGGGPYRDSRGRLSAMRSPTPRASKSASTRVNNLRLRSSSVSPEPAGAVVLPGIVPDEGLQQTAHQRGPPTCPIWPPGSGQAARSRRRWIR